MHHQPVLQNLFSMALTAFLTLTSPSFLQPEKHNLQKQRNVTCNDNMLISYTETEKYAKGSLLKGRPTFFHPDISDLWSFDLYILNSMWLLAILFNNSFVFVFISMFVFVFVFLFMFVFAHQQAEWESAGGANSDESISYSSLATALITSLGYSFSVTEEEYWNFLTFDEAARGAGVPLILLWKARKKHIVLLFMKFSKTLHQIS